MENLTNIKSLLFSSCCVIWYNGKARGTGWVAPGNKILSAGHLFTGQQVCDQINAGMVNSNTITAVFSVPPDDQDCRGTAPIRTEYVLKFICGAYKEDPLVDFCILEAEEKIVQAPLPIASTTCIDGVFLTAGYGFELSRLSNAEGTIIGYVSERDGTHLKLSSKECAQSGFSGCPIYSVTAGGVIGIQSQQMDRGAIAEADSVFAYRIGNTIRNALDDPTSFHGLSAITPLDKAMDLRKEGDDLLQAGKNNDAYICYKEAEKLLFSAVGKEGAYIDDIRTRIKKSSAQR